MDLFDLAEKRLAWAGARQSLLAQNVANADTPGYRPRDLTGFAEALGKQAQAAPMARTSALHLAGTRTQAAAPGSVATSADGWERAPDGNAVQLDRELTRIADTDGAQALAVDLYQKYAGMVRLALGR